jgi:hypothetical protein
MSTNDKKVSIYLKKFLPQQQITENFLDYLHTLILESFAQVWQSNGVFEPDINVVQILSSDTPDTFDIVTPLIGTDGPPGHIINLDSIDANNIPFENATGIDYYVGLRFQDIPANTEINVRTGEIKYTFTQERIGELAEPDVVVDDGDETLTITVDSIFEAGVSNAGRKVLVYLKNPVSQADTFEEATVIWDGVNNKIETLTALGQTIGSISVDPSDYQVFAIGSTVRRNTDLRLDPDILFIGIIEGDNGNSPSTFDQSDVNNLSFGLVGITSLFGTEHSLVDGTHTDITPETITTKQTTTGLQLDTQVNASDEDTPDIPVSHTLFNSIGGSGLQGIKWGIRDSGGSLIAYIDAHGNAYFQNLAAVSSIFQSNLTVTGNTTFGDDINTDTVTFNSVQRSLTDLIYIIDADANGTNSYKFYNQAIGAANLLMEILSTGDVTVKRDLTAGRDLIAVESAKAGKDVLTGGASPYAKNSDLSEIAIVASLNEVYDETINRKLLRVVPENPASTLILISPSFVSLADGSTYRLPNGSLLSNYAGGNIDFATGIITGGGDTFTPVDFTGQADKWFKYSLNLLQNNEILVLSNDTTQAGNFGTTSANTPNPPIAEGSIAFAVIAVQNDSGVSVTAINDLVETNIIRIPVGGSGGGSGDASKTDDVIDDWFQDSPFVHQAKNVFSNSGSDYVDAGETTAIYDTVNKQYNLDTGSILQSINHLDTTEFPEVQSEFLDFILDILEVEFLIVMPDDFEEDDGVLEVTRDGNEFQVVEFESRANGVKYFKHSFTDEAVISSLVEYGLANNDATLALDDGTAFANRSQEFLGNALVSAYRKLSIEVFKTGTPLGSYRILILKDDAGEPDLLNAVYDSGYIAVSTLSAGTNLIELTLQNLMLVPGDKYHIVIDTDADYKASYDAGVDEIAIEVDSSAPGIPDSKVYDGAVWADVAGNSIGHLLEGRSHDLRFKYTAANDDVSILGYSMAFRRNGVYISDVGVENYQKVTVNGDDNIQSIPVTGFIPHPSFLRMLINNTGQTFMHGAGFTLDNETHTIKLESGVLEFPGEILEIILTQNDGVAVDNLEQNSGDLAEIHAGRFKTSGRGYACKRNDGEVREFTIDNDDNIVIKDDVGAVVKEHIIYFQRRFLTAPISTSIADVTDLKLANLTIGKWYELNMSFDAQYNVGNGVSLIANHDSNVLLRCEANGEGGTGSVTGRYRFSRLITFQATATEITFQSVCPNVSEIIQGDGTPEQTFVELKEYNNLITTSKFTP